MAEKKVVIVDGELHTPIMDGDTVETAAVPVSPTLHNLMRKTDNGLYADIYTINTSTVRISGRASTTSPMTANVQISSVAGNQLGTRSDGLYVAPASSQLMNLPTSYIQPPADTVTVRPSLTPGLLGEVQYMFTRTTGNQTFIVDTSANSLDVIEMYTIRLVMLGGATGSVVKFSTSIRWLDGTRSVADTSLLAFPTGNLQVAVYDLFYSPRTVGYYLSQVV